ncbi:hypothetical protein ACTXT7_012603 [Hymenolepis weldensis]
MEVDDSEGEELDYYIENCPLNNFSKSSQPLPNYIVDSLTSNFAFGKNVESSSGKCKPSNPILKRRRSLHTLDFDSRRMKRVPEPANDIQIMYNNSPPSDNLNDSLPNVPQHRRNHSLSPRRVIPFDVFERNYQAHMRSHSVFPTRKISYADPRVLQISDNSHNVFPRLDVENGQRKCNLATVAPFELLKRNYQRMERCRSLPSFSDSGRRTESTSETEKTPTIISQQVSDLSRTVPDWFSPSRSSTVRLSRSVLERHSLSSSSLLDSTITVKRADFEEFLRVISDSDTDVGFYECQFNTNDNRSTVRIRSKGEYLLANTEYYTSLTSDLDFHLNVLKEISEYTEKTKDRSTRRIIKSRVELNNLVVEIEEIVNSHSTQSTRRYPLNDIERFLSNGALLIMKRIYAIKRIENTLTACTLGSEGNLCKFSLELLNEGNTGNISGIQTEIAMKQILESTLGNITTMTYFTNNGQLLSIVQVGLPLVFKALGLPKPPKKEQYLSASNIVEDEFNWMENCILFSKYTERKVTKLHHPVYWPDPSSTRVPEKEELKSRYHLYLGNHPELIDLIKEFLQVILLEKPEDTLSFAANFFGSFSARHIQPPRLGETEESVEG